MSGSIEEIRQRLVAIVDELADAAIASIRRQMRDADAHADARDAIPERQITRARRSVEKAVHLLSPSPNLDEE